MSEEKKNPQVDEVFDASKRMFDASKNQCENGCPTQPVYYGDPISPQWSAPYVVGESEWFICSQHNTNAGIIPVTGTFNTSIIKPSDECWIYVHVRKDGGMYFPYNKTNIFDAIVISVTSDELTLRYHDDIAGVMREVVYTPENFFNVDNNIDIRITSCRYKPSPYESRPFFG